MREVAIGPQDSLLCFKDCFDGLILHLLAWHGVVEPPPGYVKAILHHESRFNPLAESKTGAEGLGQLVDRTWAGLDPDPHTRESPYDIFTNLSRTIRNLVPLFPWARKHGGVDHVLHFVAAGYNLGPGNVQSAQKVSLGLGGVPTRWPDVAGVIAPALAQRGWDPEKAAAKQRETTAYVERIVRTAEGYAVDFIDRKPEG